MKKLGKALVLLCVLAAFAGGYFYMQKQAATKTEGTKEIEGRFDLTDQETENLRALSWTEGGVSHSFTKTDGVWVNDQEEYPVNQDKLESLGNTLTALQATRQLENVTSPEDYGINGESFEVKALWEDGSSTTFTMGAQTPFGDGYYLTTKTTAGEGTEAAKDGGIVTIETSLTEPFTYSEEAFVQKDALPDRSGLTRMSLGTGVDLTYQAGGDVYEPEKHWSDTATGETVDEESAQKAADTLKNLTLGSFVKANATQQELEGYGLTEETGFAVKLYQGEEVLLDLLLGKEQEASTQVAEQSAEGEAAQPQESNAYVRLADSQQVYTLDATTYQELTAVSMETLFDRNLVGLPYELLDNASFEIAGAKYVLEGPAVSVASTETDTEASTEAATEAVTESAAEAAPNADSEAAAGEETEVETQTAEEEIVPATDPTGIWEALKTLKATALAQSPAGELVMTLTITRTDASTTRLSIATCDVDSYVAQVDEKTPVLVSASEVDTLIRRVKSSLPAGM